MRIQIKKSFILRGGLAEWQSEAVPPVEEISKRIDFPEINQTIHVGFESLEKDHDFYHKNKDNNASISLIVLGKPKFLPLSTHYSESKNKHDFLQIAFLHEIGHSIFGSLFSCSTSNPAYKLRTIFSDLSGASLADEIHENIFDDAREFLVRRLGNRLEERFCDSFAMLASASLGMQPSSLNELIENRTKEPFFSDYDNSDTLSQLLQRISERSHISSPLSMMECAIQAKEFALKGFRDDLGIKHLSDSSWLESQTASLRASKGPQSFQERLQHRRETSSLDISANLLNSRHAPS